MFTDVLPALTAAYIEIQMTQEALFAYYLDIPESIVNKCADSNFLIRSPLRSDKHPTAGFYYTGKGKLRFKDFAGHFHGDIYDLVGSQNNLYPKDRIHFNLILEKIARDHALWYYSNTYRNSPIRKHLDTPKKQYSKIDVKFREWAKADIQYWKKFGADFQTIKEAKIFPADAVWLNDNLLYTSTTYDPAYAFWVAKNKWKIYWPSRRTDKFLCNTNLILGLHLVRNAKYGLLTQSMKAVASFLSVAKLTPYYDMLNACALCAESITPSQKELNYLEEHWENRFGLTDFDYAGVKMARKLRKLGFNSLFLTTGKMQSLDFRAKDFADLVSLWGIEKCKDLIEVLVEGLEEGNIYSKEYYDYTNFMLNSSIHGNNNAAVSFEDTNI